MSNSQISILLIEDNPGDARLVQEMLREGGDFHRFRHALSLAEGLAEMEREEATLILLDLGLPDSEGLKGIEIVASRFPERPIVVLTGLNSSDTGFAAVRAGAQDYLAKEEVTGPGLLRTINYAIERQRLERQLRYAQKMESLGNLTRGIAHDFNNILAAIIGYASVLEMKIGQQDSLQAPVRQILSAADRAATLTRALLSFSRSQPGKMRQLDLLELMTRFLHVLPSLLGSKISISQEISAEALWITGDPAQLEQVLFNLATNARQAMPAGGTLALRLDRYLLPDDFRQQHGFGKPGRYARIAMSDSGVGIDPELVQRIFEPFFTTRETGDGTGLGLAVTYGIVKQHRGYIVCRSVAGEGTTFEILLPLENNAPQGDKDG